MSRDLGIDQSLSKCAYTCMIDGEPVNHLLSKTGNSKVKNKRKDAFYYDTLQEQIHHICEELVEAVEDFEPTRITFESLSFGSVGSATRDLACLYGAMRETLMVSFPNIPVYEYAPTSIKSYARDFLAEARQFDGVLATGKPKKVKMDKKLMVEATRELFGEDYLSWKGLNYSTGLDDLADSTWLAHKTWSSYGKKT